MALLEQAKASAKVGEKEEASPSEAAAPKAGRAGNSTSEQPNKDVKKTERAEDHKGGDHKAKKKVKHKAKHAAPPSEPENAPSDDEGESEAGGDSEQPDAEPQDSQSEAPQDGAEGGGSPPQQPSDSGGDGDEGGADAGGDQQQGGQQAQGGTPVPNPAAPGAGDDTSGGDDTPDANAGTGDTGAGEAPPDANGPETGGPGLPQLQMPPALKEEYQRLDQMLQQALYKTPNDAIAGHVLQVLYPQGPHKISGAIHICATLTRELFIKAKAPPQLTLPFARDVVAHVLQLGEQVKQIQYSQQEIAAIMGGTLEAAMTIFGGVKKSQFQHIQHLIPRSAMGQHARNYTKLHGHAKGAIEANKSQPHPMPMPPPGGAAAVGGAGPQGPQGAPPQTPQQSVAPSGPPPAAQPQGGPLAQGAAAAQGQ